jgi:DNA-binding transcriptional LysR family regulator
MSTHEWRRLTGLPGETIIHKWKTWFISGAIDVELLSYTRLFVEVARTKSFRRAAEALEMPHSTLSRHISELEKTIGLRLLNRSTRKVELTEAGEVYFKRCQSIVEEARVAHESLLDVAERPTGTLRVSMPADLATGYLAPIIAEFAKTYPLIAFEFDLSPRPVDLQAEPFDLAIRIGPQPTAPSTLVARPVVVLPRYLCASPQYLNSSSPLRHPNDLHRHEVCIVEGAARLGQVARTFYRGDESVEAMIGTRFAMNSVALSRGLAIQGVGLAVLDNVLAADDVTLGRLVRVLPEWNLAPLQVHAVTYTRLLPARTRLFIDFLKTRLGESYIERE